MIDNANGNDRPSTALQVQRPVPLGLMRPIAPATEILAAQNETREMIAKTLQAGRDYGAVPGTDKDKKTLLKPGAERVCMAFGCVPRFTLIDQEADHNREVPWLKTKWVEVSPRPDDWQNRKTAGTGRNRKFNNDGVDKWVWQERTEERGLSLGFYRYVVKCELVHRDSGALIGEGLGSCSTIESKYIDRPRDSENTVLKMGKKRAFVDATLTAFGLSDQFTQDIEDAVVEEIPAVDEGEHAPSAKGPSSIDQRAPLDTPEPSCPTCGGRMWDNRTSKTNPKAPDYKCRDRSCDGTLWPGQWPPSEPASQSQREQIAALLPGAKFKQARSRVALEERLADTAKPMTAKEADEYIQKLKKLQPTASDVAADELKARQDAAKNGTGPDHNTMSSSEKPLSELPF